jgi:BRCT domain type II-containing protein
MKKLSSKLATALMKKGQIKLGDLEINMWQGNTYNTLMDQLSWNKIVSYTEINSHSTGENGEIVFTGVMQIKRNEAAEYATKLGFNVRQQVSSETDFIVIGTENVSPSKIAKAIELTKKKKADIKIMDEITFLQLVSEHIIKTDH